LDAILSEISRLPTRLRFGRVSGVQGLLIEATGIDRLSSVGARVRIVSREGADVPAEVVGYRGGHALLMPFKSLEGIGIGSKTYIAEEDPYVYPSAGWLGRVVNAMGDPIDGKGPIPRGPEAYALRNTPPMAHTRRRVGEKLDLGVRALNTFLTTCKGQRMGIFSGSGVGKSILMSMLARFTASDVAVIGLIGERGREVQEFIQDSLGPEGLARSVVVVATSDESALMRRQAAYMTLTAAEFFRDQGCSVLCVMDSVTRFAMAQREIGLSGGEPPASKGYTPTVFSELPKLLERAGPSSGDGSITGFFTVLVEGDDHNEPIADAVRGILDGHIVLERRIAERGRFPAINILRSVSRTMPNCNSPQENELVQAARRHLANYDSMEEMIRLGAYRKGSDATIDEAIHYHPALEAFLAQDRNDHTTLEDGYARLEAILANRPAPEGGSQGRR
jgi:flagellum-specific ATP synthase